MLKIFKGTTGRFRKVAWEYLKSTSSALHVFVLNLAMERNPGTKNPYGVGVDECKGTVIEGIVAVDMYGGAPALLFSLQNDDAAAVTVTIVGSLDQNDIPRTRSYTLAAGEIRQFGGEMFDTGLNITASVSLKLTVKGRAK